MSEVGPLTSYILAGSLGVIAAVLVALDVALRRAALTDAERRRTLVGAAAVLLAWFAVTAGLAWLGAYRPLGDGTPTIQLGLLVPILAGVVLMWRSPRFARVVEAVPQHWLVGIQVFRVLGFVFVVLWTANHLPGFFALPAGLGDLAVGLLAPLVAWRYLRAPATGVYAVVAWNVLGLADLAVALATGFMTARTAYHLFGFAAPNLLIDEFPLVLIPVYLVPIAILLHIASLRRFCRDHIRSSPLSGTGAVQA